MAKSRQQQKKKDRERRVAQKKLAIAAKKREQKKTEKESQTTGPRKAKLTKEAIPKPDYVPTSKKSPFTQRRSGG